MARQQQARLFKVLHSHADRAGNPSEACAYSNALANAQFIESHQVQA
jgi:hypothetical protein